MRRPKLVDSDVVDVRQLDLCCLQAVPDRETRKACPVLDAAKPFFLRRSDELAVDNEGGCGIAVKCIDAKDDHVSLRTAVGSSLTVALGHKPFRYCQIHSLQFC